MLFKCSNLGPKESKTILASQNAGYSSLLCWCAATLLEHTRWRFGVPDKMWLRLLMCNHLALLSPPTITCIMRRGVTYGILVANRPLRSVAHPPRPARLAPPARARGAREPRCPYWLTKTDKINEKYI
jgi:hypothetical protein